MIAAVESGAHVYVEKPISHTVMEGRAMVNAARAADRLVQVGTHRRVSPHNKSGMQFLKSGGAGDIGMVRCFVHSTGDAGTKTPDSEPPAGLDWDFWCGPAPLNPFNTTIHPKGFRNHLDYANGTLGDWGIHWLDQVLWWTEEKWPRNVSSYGGRFIKKDSTDAPDTQVAIYDFETFTCTWEHRRYAGNNSEKHPLGSYFYGTKGVFHLGWQDGWTFYPARRGDPAKHQDPILRPPDSQNIPELFADFLTSIQEKRLPVCDIEIGHYSTNCALLGMLSWKLGRSVQWDGAKEVCIGDAEATTMLKREYRGPWKYPQA
jgi:predicted dehydrogenase